MYRGCSAQKKGIKNNRSQTCGRCPKGTFLQQVFQTIEWAFLILCQKVRKIPVFKPNTGFSVAPPVGLEPTTHGLTVRRSTD